VVGTSATTCHSDPVIDYTAGELRAALRETGSADVATPRRIASREALGKIVPLP
jgi:hypothetical protein